jgi:hypothetical protein
MVDVGEPPEASASEMEAPAGGFPASSQTLTGESAGDARPTHASPPAGQTPPTSPIELKPGYVAAGAIGVMGLLLSLIVLVWFPPDSRGGTAAFVGLFLLSASVMIGALKPYWMRWKLAKRIGSAVVAAAAATGLLVAVLQILPSANSSDSRASSRLCNALEPTSSGEGDQPLRSGEALFDDFSGDKLDPARWTWSSSDKSDPQARRQIYIKDGKLHLVVCPDNSATEVNATLAPILPGRPIKTISMKMALVSQEGGSEGAASLIVLSKRGREQRLWMGPNGEDNPALGYYICKHGTCHDKVGAELVGQQTLQIGPEFAVEAVVNEDGGLRFNVSGHTSASASQDQEPITNFNFYLYSDPRPNEPRRNFQVTIDDVRITYE